MHSQCLTAVFVAALAAVAPRPALADNYDGDWHFSLTPYAWDAGAHASLQIRSPGGAISRTNANSTPFQDIKRLHALAMVFADVHKGLWSAFLDVVYVSLGDSTTIVRSVTLPDGSMQIPINLHSSVGLEDLIVTSGLGYAVLHDDHAAADIFVGLRAAGVNTTLKWQFAQPLNQFPQTGSAS
jgi:hypothetical protein